MCIPCHPPLDFTWHLFAFHTWRSKFGEEFVSFCELKSQKQDVGNPQCTLFLEIIANVWRESFGDDDKITSCQVCSVDVGTC